MRPELDDKSQDYIAAWVSLPVIGDVGIKYDFDKNWTILDGAGVAALGTDKQNNQAPDAEYNYISIIDVPANVTAVTIAISTPAYEAPPVKIGNTTAGFGGQFPLDDVGMVAYDSTSQPTQVTNPLHEP